MTVVSLLAPQHSKAALCLQKAGAMHQSALLLPAALPCITRSLILCKGQLLVLLHTHSTHGQEARGCKTALQLLERCQGWLVPITCLETEWVCLCWMLLLMLEGRHPASIKQARGTLGWLAVMRVDTECSYIYSGMMLGIAGCAADCGGYQSCTCQCHSHIFLHIVYCKIVQELCCHHTLESTSALQHCL